jgi:proline iminopeptidase
MLKIVLYGIAGLALGAAMGAYAWYATMGPLYRPGDVRRGKDLAEPLVPAVAEGSLWRVAPDVELYHFEEGAGTPILVVHGGPGFPPTQPWRAGAFLAARYRLLYYHQRGCGLSSRPVKAFSGSNQYANMRALHQKLGLPAQVADIERVRRLLGVDRLILLGHSFGADIAALYAAEFPEHVRALVTVAPADMAVLPKKGGDLFELVRARLPEGMRPEYAGYLAEYFDFNRAFRRSEPESSAFYGRFARFYGAAAGGAIPPSSDAAQAGYQPLAIYLSMGKHHDYSKAYGGVRAPVLVIHGASDMQPEQASRDFAARFPNARFARIEGAAHFVFDDRPEEFAREVDGFLGSLPPAS